MENNEPDEATLRMVQHFNSQAAQILALRAILTLQLAGKEVTEDAALEVLSPGLSEQPGVALEMSAEIGDIVLSILSDAKKLSTL